MAKLTQKQYEVLKTMQNTGSAKATAVSLHIPLTAVYSRIYRIEAKTGYNIVYPDQLIKCAQKYFITNYFRIVTMSLEELADKMTVTISCNNCPVFNNCDSCNNSCKEKMIEYLKTEI